MTVHTVYGSNVMMLFKDISLEGLITYTLVTYVTIIVTIDGCGPIN